MERWLFARLGQRGARTVPPEAVVYRRVGTHGGAVEAYHAARCVDGMVGEAYALRLAYPLAFAAVGAQLGVDVDSQHGVACGSSEERAYGADAVADYPAVFPRCRCHYQHCGGRYAGGRQRE